MRLTVDNFQKQMEKLFMTPGEELAGLSITVNNDEKTLYRFSLGQRRYGEAEHKPLSTGSICRVASISKTVTALTTAELINRKIIDPEKDISEYLGYEVRNPHFPDKAISISELLSHRSSLRDGTSYNLPKEVHIKSILTGEASLPNWSSFREPGAHFTYCNLGFGVTATILEKVTGKRFDQLTNEIVMTPLNNIMKNEGLKGKASFNTQDFSLQELDHTVELYRKDNPEGEWKVQKDHYPSLIKDKEDKSLYDDYTPGTNGTLFSPQGGMRASTDFLAILNRLFLCKGKIGETPIASEEAVKYMMSPLWRFDENDALDPDNREMDRGFVKESGAGLFHILNTVDSTGSDSLLPQGGPPCWGHHGDAYGFKGGMLFDPVQKLGFSYIVTGTAVDPEKKRGLWSVHSQLEETIMSNIVKTFWEVPSVQST